MMDPMAFLFTIDLHVHAPVEGDPRGYLEHELDVLQFGGELTFLSLTM
ncbi:MAG: hypothetical protein MZV70_37285 [Desulfobacterales bacterium]|nr:hypothetical protein [Desulfobacterales bacterium]